MWPRATISSFNTQGRKVSHDLLPAVLVADGILAATGCAPGYGKREEGLEPEAVHLEEPGEAAAPGPDVEIDFHGQVARGPATQRERTGSPAAVVAQRLEGADENRLLGGSG